MGAEHSTQVRVGRIGRPHGLRGEFVLITYTDEPERRFAPDATVRESDGDRIWTVATSRWHQDRLLVTLHGVADRDAADRLRGVELLADVHSAERPAGADEYWDRQLIGLTVLDHQGTPVGSVRAVQHLPAQDLLEVESDGQTALVPLVEELVPEIQVDKGFLRLADVSGLIDHAEG